MHRKVAATAFVLSAFFGLAAFAQQPSGVPTPGATYQVKVPGPQELYMAFPTINQGKATSPVVLVPKSQLGDEFTALDITVREFLDKTRNNKRLTLFEVTNFTSPPNQRQWLSMDDDNNLRIDPAPPEGFGRGMFWCGPHALNKEYTFVKVVYVFHLANSKRTVKFWDADDHYFLEHNIATDGKGIESQVLSSHLESKDDATGERRPLLSGTSF